MPLFTKPQFNSVWASAGTKLTPEPTKISQGWVVEIPPYEFDNWIQGRQDQLLAHINQVGIPMWDQTVEYQAGKSYTQGTTTGIVYRAVTTNTNVNPELDIQGNWTVAFEATGQALLKANNLSDVPDKALARENLGIATTPFYDGRYLAKDSNLADVPNKATARNNLGLGNSATLNVGSVGGTVAAGDDARIVNATPNGRGVYAGSGLVGGGNFTADRSISMGTPATVTATSTNYVAGGTHGHSIDIGSFSPTSYVNVTGSRALNTNYWNTTGKPMFVSVTANRYRFRVAAAIYVNDLLIAINSNDPNEDGDYGGDIFGYSSVSAIVPVGAYYRARCEPVGMLQWVESR